MALAAEEDAPKRIRCRSEQRRPVAVEPLVHQNLEAEAVAPEPKAGIHVSDADRRMVDHTHTGSSGVGDSVSSGGLPSSDWIQSLDSEYRPVCRRREPTVANSARWNAR